MDALSKALARLVRRQEISDRRLADIEKALGIAQAPAPRPEPPPPPRVEVPPPLPVEPAPEFPAPTPPQPDASRLETRLGLAWINRIGVVTVTLCVAFIFKYAVDNAWIGPLGRVGLGVLAGLAALAIAARTWRGGQKTYAQGISGLGLAILYLSFYSSFGFYPFLLARFALLRV